MRWLWIPVLGLFAFVTVEAAMDGQVWLAVVYAVVGLVLSLWLSPWQGGRSPRHKEVSALPETMRPVVIYWRPGCPYCMRLRASLGGVRNEAIWINIWQDEEAAAFVRSVNDGNETVPTVVIDGTPHTNPDPGMVRAQLEALA